MATEQKMATFNDRLIEVKEEFSELSAAFRTLMKDIDHLTSAHIVPMQKCMGPLLPLSSCACYHANRVFSRCGAPQPLRLMMLTHRFIVPRQLTFSSPSPISPISSRSGSPSSVVPNSDSSHNSGDALPIHISTIPPSLQTGIEAPQPSSSDSTPSLETPMLTDVSSESDGDSGGELWRTPPSGGVGEDSV